MSLSFRPVNEVWGEPSSCFVDRDTLVRILHCLAKKAGCRSEEHDYADNTSIWIEDGVKMLEFISGDPSFTVQHLAKRLGLKKQEREKLGPLISNMMAMASAWRDSVDRHGALTFYVDAY
jgi:hypothetical protein